MTAVKLVSALLGLVAGIVAYPYLDKYLLAVIAFIGAIAVGVVVYMILVNVLSDLTK
jgi:hypothetical protein